MSENAKVKYDDKNLQSIMQMLNKEMTLRVGILGSKAAATSHKNSDKTNAEIGTFHEFGGTSKNGKEQPPRRSFLEDSLKYKLTFSGEQGKALRKALFTQFFEKKAPEKFLQNLGSKCLQIIEEAFATNGFGMWKPLAKKTEKIIAKKHKVLTMDEAKNATMGKYRKAYKFWYGQLVESPNGDIGITGGRNILTETGKLRRSISFKIIKKK